MTVTFNCINKILIRVVSCLDLGRTEMIAVVDDDLGQDCQLSLILREHDVNIHIRMILGTCKTIHHNNPQQHGHKISD